VQKLHGAEIRKAGSGKRLVVKRIKPKDSRFSMGKIFWLSDGIYVLEEITNAQRCSKRRIAIFRPISMDVVIDDKEYEVYKLAGRGV